MPNTQNYCISIYHCVSSRKNDFTCIEDELAVILSQLTSDARCVFKSSAK